MWAPSRRSTRAALLPADVGDDNAQLDYLTEEVLPIIARCGWMVQAVEGSGPYAPFAYTVGLTARGLPELLVTGLQDTAAATILNRVAAGPELAPGDIFDFDGRNVEVVHVPHPEAHLYVAHDLYGDRLRAVQLAWQDERGHFPLVQGPSRRPGRPAGSGAPRPRGVLLTSTTPHLPYVVAAEDTFGGGRRG